MRSVIVRVLFSLSLALGAGFFWGAKSKKAIQDDPYALQVEVFAQQFKWTIRYAGVDNELGKWKLPETESNPPGLDSSDVKGWDDVIVDDTLFLPNEKTEVHLRSHDVVHCADFRDFGIKANAFPGKSTILHLKPDSTTAQMRAHHPGFDYELRCGKICGQDHSKMKIKVVVGTDDEFWTWLKRHQKAITVHPKLPDAADEGDGK